MDFIKSNRDVVQAVKTLIADRTGKPTDDNQWSVRLILFYLNIMRSRIIYEKRHQRHELDNKFNHQTINCIKLEEIDAVESTLIPPSGRRILKSTVELPKPVFGKFTTVVSLTADVEYDYVDWDNIGSRINSRIPHQANLPYYTIKDIGKGSHLYILNDKFKETVAVTAVFENPLEAQYYPGCGEARTYCNPLDDPFIIDQELLPIVMEVTAEKMINLRNTALPDIVNDNMDSTAVQMGGGADE